MENNILLFISTSVTLVESREREERAHCVFDERNELFNSTLEKQSKIVCMLKLFKVLSRLFLVALLHCTFAVIHLHSILHILRSTLLRSRRRRFSLATRLVCFPPHFIIQVTNGIRQICIESSIDNERPTTRGIYHWILCHLVFFSLSCWLFTSHTHKCMVELLRRDRVAYIKYMLKRSITREDPNDRPGVLQLHTATFFRWELTSFANARDSHSHVSSMKTTLGVLHAHEFHT